MATYTREIVSLLREKPGVGMKIADIATKLNLNVKTTGSALQQLIKKPDTHGIVRTGYGMYAYISKPKSVPALTSVDTESEAGKPPVIHSMDAVSEYPPELVKQNLHPHVELFGMTMDGTRLIRDEFGDLYYLGERV